MFLSACTGASALAVDSIQVQGTVVDAITEVSIEDAELAFMLPDSTIVSRGKTIDLCKKYGIDDGSVFIRFNIPVPDAGKYIVRVSASRYEDRYVNIEIPAKEYGKRPESWEIADVALDRSAISLGEAEVRASKVMMVNRGDTVVYNASLFQLAEGSMLDALIAQLPGVRLTEDGQIFVNGTYVPYILVNGKDFFQGSPGVALRNLPAYTVDKVKTYRRGDKADYLLKRDSVERLGDELVLDVILKKDYNENWLANADVGYGTAGRYTARLFGLRFTDRQRLAAFANFNNIGWLQKPSEEVERSVENLSVHPVTEKSGGLDFSAEFGKRKLSLGSVLTAAHRDGTTITEVSANSALAGSQVFSRSRSTSRNRSTDLEWRNLLSLPMPKVYTEFTLGAEYGKQTGRSGFQSVDLDALPAESYRLAVLDSVFGVSARDALLRSLINRYERQAYQSTRRYSVIASGQSKWKAPLTGSPVSLYAEMAYENQCSSGNAEYALRTFPTPGTLSRVQLEDASWDNLAGKVWLDYEYGLPAGFKLVAAYEFAATRMRSDRMLDTLYIVPDEGLARLLAADLQNSYDRILRKTGHTPRLGLHRSFPRWLLSAEFPVRFANVRFREARLSSEVARPGRRYVAFEPSLSANAACGFSTSYSYREEEPNMVCLTGLKDTSDPLNVMLGNANLRNVGRHTAGIQYARVRAEKVQTLGLSGNFTLTQHAVALHRSYDVSTGTSVYTPRSVNGNYELLFQGNFSQAAGRLGRFVPEAITQVGLNRSVGYADVAGSGGASSRLTMKSLTWAQQLGVKYQSGDVSLKLFARGEWLHGVSSQGETADVNIRKFRYAFTASLPLVWGIRVDADLSLYTLRGYEARSMNTDNLVLNASLSKSFLRDKSLTLQITGFDLFDRLSNVQQTVNAQGRIETWTNTLRRYAMVHLVYRFNKKPRQAR